MSKQSIINHFSEHGIINCMKPEALSALFAPYRDFLIAKGVPDHFDLSEDKYKIYLGALRAALMSVNMDDAAGRELSNKLDEIDLINKNYNQMFAHIELCLPLWRDGLEATGLDMNDQLSLIVALCIDKRPDVQNNIALIVSRVQTMDTSTNRDYQWIGDFIEVESNGRMKLPTFSIPSDAELKLRVDSVEKKINDGFIENNYMTQCKVILYPKADDGEIWVLVEHGGRIVVKETMSETGQAGMVKYPPLTRSSVVLDTNRKTLRIKSGAEWMYNLFLKSFAEFFCNQENAFVPGQMYHFKPIYRHGLTKAFRRDEFQKRITKVNIVGIKLDVSDNSEGNQITLNNPHGRDVRNAWDKFRSLREQRILSVTLRVYVKGSDSHITVKIDKERGLFVGKPAYSGLIRSWLRRLGFEKNYTVKEYKSLECENEQNEQFWPVVANLLQAGEISKSSLYALEDLAPGIGDFMWQFVDKDDRTPNYENYWEDAHGIKWEVKYNDITDSYYGSNINVELGIEAGPEIDASEVEILPIDKDRFIKTIQQALMPGKRVKLDEKKEGIYRLGELNAHDVTVFLSLGIGSWKPAFYGKNTTNSSIAVVTFFQNPPDQYVEQVDNDELQHAWLNELLFWDTKQERLLPKTLLDEYLHPNLDLSNQDESQPLKYWPGKFPESRKLFLVSMSLGYGKVHIKYAEEERTFAFDSLLMFRNTKTDNKQNYSANVRLLFKLIELSKKYGDEGFLLSEVGSSGSLNKLNKAIGTFFGTEDYIYEEIPDKPKRYRLTFARCTSTELIED